MAQKQCTKCGKSKPYEQFSKLTKAKDGHQYHCKECNNKDNYKFRHEIDPEYMNRWFNKHKNHWKEYMNAFGLGVRLGVDLPNENTGGIPDTVVYNSSSNQYTINFIKPMGTTEYGVTINCSNNNSQSPLTPRIGQDIIRTTTSVTIVLINSSGEMLTDFPEGVTVTVYSLT